MVKGKCGRCNEKVKNLVKHRIEKESCRVECEKCGKKQANINDHMMTVHYKRPRLCDLPGCEETAIRQNMPAHKKTWHAPPASFCAFDSTPENIAPQKFLNEEDNTYSTKFCFGFLT
eukprot:Lithocolla_globosa_v1_NODE_703_length_3414_cov_5.515927.p2 type:complete len:117 gc:universal NODE_703_length_3414_cov_5.515927:2141-1791(-)